MNYFYITGSSRGLGKALAELLLEHNNKVVGMARTQTIEHPNYTHVMLDLSKAEQVEAFTFPQHNDAAKIVLINNAGAIGDIKRVGGLEADTIINNYTINLVSPSLLCNSFIGAYEGVACEKVIVNVSSGAGKHPIDAWSTYCASKAGLDLFSRVADAEQNINTAHPVKVLSVAPGVVDTKMQAEIRASDEAEFSRHAEFIDYKNSGNLATPKLVAEKYFHILCNLQDYSETLYSVRDIELNPK